MTNEDITQAYKKLMAYTPLPATFLNLALEPLYKECLAVQATDETVVTEEMIAAGRTSSATFEHAPIGQELDAIYRAMAAVAPKPDTGRPVPTPDSLDGITGRIGPTGPGYWPNGAPSTADLLAYITQLEADRVVQKKLHKAETAALHEANDNLVTTARELDDENMRLKSQAQYAEACLVRLDAVLSSKDSRIAELKSELAAMRVATNPTPAQTGAGDTRPPEPPKPMPAGALKPQGGDSRRVGG